MKHKKIFGITGALLTLVIPFIIMLTNPHIEESQSFCPFKMITGLPCPGCGITKSIIFFYEGDIYKSLAYHVLGPVVVVFCLAISMQLAVELYTGKRYFRKILYSARLAYILGISLALYHLARLVYFIHGHSFSQILAESIWK